MAFSSNIRSLAFIAFLSAVSNQLAWADRPAIEASATPPPRTAETAPTSAVEQMMQRESGTVLRQLPAEEIQPGETIAIDVLAQPRRGASMEKVRQLFGEPETTRPAVGEPPITTWFYPDRIVYFEYRHVVHVVPR